MSEDSKSEVAALLTANGLAFKTDAVIHGMRSDFVVETPSGVMFVIEVKRWLPTEANIQRALHQLHVYRDVIGIAIPVFVLKGLTRSYPVEGLVSERDLMDVLAERLSSVLRGASLTERFTLGDRGVQSSHLEDQQDVRVVRKIFAAMPFAPNYDDTYLVGMVPAAADLNAECSRIDHENFEGDIVQEIETRIRASAAVIVDLSESKPNVLYEAGFAHALRIPTVHICSSSLTDLPFDVRNWNTIGYSLGQTSKLREPLIRRLRAILEGPDK